MGKRLLLDMIRLRKVMTDNPATVLPEGFFNDSPVLNGLKSVRELAAFRFSCRRCEDAPCISVCPADALEKDAEGIIERHLNLCISCKSCVTICPFGTMMTDFFHHHRNKDLFYDLGDDKEMKLFAEACPEGVASVVETDESPTENIYRLNEKILVREFIYSSQVSASNH